MNVEADEIGLENAHIAVDASARMIAIMTEKTIEGAAVDPDHRKSSNVHAEESVRCTGMCHHQVCVEFFPSFSILFCE